MCLQAISIILDGVECFNWSLMLINQIKSELKKTAIIFWFLLGVEILNISTGKDYSDSGVVLVLQRIIVVAIILSIIYKRKYIS
jgi:hypothetical protein